MAKVSYANLKLKLNQPHSGFDFNGQNIEVIHYLPIEDKYDLVMITLQKAKEDEIYNPIKLDMYFHLHLVYMYTNLSFTDKQRENEPKIYDILKCNGFIDEMLNCIPEEEYNELQYYIEKYAKDSLKYKNTTGAALRSFITDLPKNAEAAANIVDNFDKEKYQAVIDFATAANGGRNIETNR